MPNDTSAALERRLQGLEDRMAIYQLIATYGPVADSGSGDVVAKMWTRDGSYDSGVGIFQGAAAVGDMLSQGELHRTLMAGGCAHLTTLPMLRVEGDRAIAVCHGQLLRRKGDGFEIWRATAVKWTLARSAAGWRVEKRENRLLDGSRPAQELFRDMVAEEKLD
jgi:hypothetical protein